MMFKNLNPNSIADINCSIGLFLNSIESVSLSFDSLSNKDILLSIVSAIVGLYFLIILLLFRNSRFPNWGIRKIIHLLGGTYISFIALLYDNLLGIILAVCIFALVFLSLVIFSKGKLLTNYFLLNFRKGENDFTFVINTILTLVILLISLIVFHNNLVIFVSGALIISWADTAGEVFGKLIPSKEFKIFNKKSISGTIGVFLISIISFILTLLIFKIPYHQSMIWKIILGAFICAIIEAISWKWFDNLSLPIIGNLIMLWMVY